MEQTVKFDPFCLHVWVFKLNREAGGRVKGWLLILNDQSHPLISTPADYQLINDKRLVSINL